MRKIVLLPLVMGLSFTLTYADQQILDDLIVTGSICAGFDCTNGESFGFDTLRLKENNLRIMFQDTSASASFPSNDWQITANDSSNGGANKFSIDDIDGGRTPFTIEASAPSHSLYVDDGGRIGLGTSTPVVEIHSKDGDSPTLRLEQDGSSGFTPQAWDVAGNEANFFIRDVTNGSTLPFRIKPGAPSSSLYIDSTGNIGLGTASPSEKLDIENGNLILNSGVISTTYTPTSNGLHNLLSLSINNSSVSGNTNAGIIFTEVKNSQQWSVRTYRDGNEFAITKLGTGDAELVIKNAGSTGASTELILGNGATCDGTWNNASSRALKENIVELNYEDAREALQQLEPKVYNYKQNKEEKYVGFIAEDVPELVANNDRKTLSPMDMVAVLTKVVQEQHKSIQSMKESYDKKIIEQEAKISQLGEMQSKIDKLESLFSTLDR